MADRLGDNDIDMYSYIAGALASRYEVIYYIDMVTNNYIQYSASSEYEKLGTTKKGDDFFKSAFKDIGRYVHQDDAGWLLREIEKKNLIKNLSQKSSLSYTYRQLLGSKFQYVNMFIVHPGNDENHILMGVLNVDSQMVREKSMEDESRRFGDIAMALARRYEVIYLVDIDTNEYLEFSTSDKYSKLDIGSKGMDFFSDTQKNMKNDIYKDDYPMMAYAMQKEHLLESLKDSGKAILNYRLLLDGRPQYVTLFAVLPEEDSRRIIIAVANIDTSKRMEEKLEDILDSALDVANNDELTGLKNKRNYAQVEMIINKDIEEETNEQFAIVVCDINGLKIINDTKGHSAGDEYIKEAAEMLRTLYKNSDIFRVGGDEFAIILTGEDFEDRNVILGRFDHLNSDYHKENKVTLSVGMSDFNPAIDNIVQDVFERADAAMYDNKRRMKHINAGNEKDYELIDKDTINFYRLFERLVSAMTDMEHLDYKLIESIIAEITVSFRLSKGVARLYKNPKEEAMGAGETLCCYDSGKKDKRVMYLRAVTSVMSIGTISVYMAEDEEPLSTIEYTRVELLMRMTLSYLTRNRLRDAVEELTFHDNSGFENFRSFFKYITEKANRLGGKVAFRYNLRHFTLVNQELGRKVGDVTLRNHYETLQRMIGDRGTLCRLGGDNFVAICGGEQLGSIVNFLAEAPIVYDLHNGKSVNISTSAGIYCIPDVFILKDPSDIMERINTAYHVAQSGGRERMVFYDDTLDESKAKSMRVQQLFPEAFRNEEFIVYYQPKVNINTGEISGAEALCRWIHDGEVVSPADFIPMLEETDDICQLDFYMLDHVCRDIRRWIDTGRKVVRISVNFSRKHMLNINLIETIIKIVDRYEVPHEFIEVELTETTTDVEFSDLKRIVNSLQKAGIYTSVDDFGVGYSSLNLIREMPWNVLKVDRSFLPIEGAERNKAADIMFRHVISMARDLGLECIVEGVETEKQVELLRSNNCEFAQGFLFDKPLPVMNFEKKLDPSFRYYVKQ